MVFDGLFEKVNAVLIRVVEWVDDVASTLARSLLSHLPSGSRALVMDRVDVAKTLRDVILLMAVLFVASFFVNVAPKFYLVAAIAGAMVYGGRRWLAVYDPWNRPSRQPPAG